MPFCIVIPAFNAADTLPAVVREALSADAALLVIDDGSTDGTGEALSSLPVEIITHNRNMGKGSALRTGFSWAVDRGFSGVVTIDADGQHDARAIRKLAETGSDRQVDILIASRFSEFDRMAGLRAWWNRFGAWCMSKRTGFTISDSQSGFRWYSSRLLSQVELSSRGYELEMEVLLKAWHKGFMIDSLPVTPHIADGRSTSHFRAVRDTWRICMTFLRYM